MVSHNIDGIVVSAEGPGLEEPHRWSEEVGEVWESGNAAHVVGSSLHLPTQPVIQSQIGTPTPGVLAVETAHVGARPGDVLWSSVLKCVGVHNRAIDNSRH